MSDEKCKFVDIRVASAVIDRLHAKLTADRAKIAKANDALCLEARDVRSAYEALLGGERDALKFELAAAQAEIARLRTELAETRTLLGVERDAIRAARELARIMLNDG
jgi:hypothetical protein